MEEKNITNTTEINAQTDAAPKAKSKTGLIAALAVLGTLAVIAGAAALYIFGGLSGARFLLSAGKYEEAKAQFQKFSFIASLADMPQECDYAYANQLLSEGDYWKAYSRFLSLSDYKDSAELANVSLYAHGDKLMADGEYKQAMEAFDKLGDYNDSADKLTACAYEHANKLADDHNFIEAKKVFDSLGDYLDSAELGAKCMIALGIEQYRQGLFYEASNTLKDYADISDTANLYFHLAGFEDCKAEGYAFASVELYEALSPYAAESEEAAEALLDPLFHYARFYGAGWRYGRYTLDADSRDGTIYFDVPWSDAEGSLGYAVDGECFQVLVNDQPWFSIRGFDTYDVKHPNEMYVIDADGKEYVFKRYTLFDQ